MVPPEFFIRHSGLVSSFLILYILYKYIIYVRFEQSSVNIQLLRNILFYYFGWEEGGGGLWILQEAV